MHTVKFVLVTQRASRASIPYGVNLCVNPRDGPPSPMMAPLSHVDPQLRRTPSLSTPPFCHYSSNFQPQWRGLRPFRLIDLNQIVPSQARSSFCPVIISQCESTTHVRQALSILVLCYRKPISVVICRITLFDSGLYPKWKASTLTRL
jgi:hypothetical protein